ncbi:hypothetical protein BDZ94DRAFT_1315569 [Collybia nuda]|uniref:Uncharacterized protein n=1 Tax=Collybia nuda TaxID=64659 RepID=A0A9P5XT31_9AGAR|nr:hypothetical protein BDZ94DRAFT_1315569 [Collybia nuda]
MILSPSIPDSEELDEPSTPSPLLSDIVSDERDTPYGTGSDWDMDSNAISADEGTGRRDIRRFKVDDIGFDQFDPDTLAESDESLLWKLDSFADAGLLYADLCVVFVQCGKCKALTARCNIHYHQCQTEGIRHESFEDLMSFCGLCQRFMTHRAALLHDCELDRLLQLSLNTTV